MSFERVCDGLRGCMSNLGPVYTVKFSVITVEFFFSKF